MSFITDRQTLNDLNIIGRQDSGSIYNIYNRCITRGGAAVLEEMLLHPMSDEEKINLRSGVIRYFSNTGIDFPFQNTDFEAIKIYLDNTDERTEFSREDNTLTKKISNVLAMDAMTMQIRTGIESVASLLREAKKFFDHMALGNRDSYLPEASSIRELLLDPIFLELLEHGKMSYAHMSKFDTLLRFRSREKLLCLIRYVYYLDVYISVGKIAESKNFTFAEASSDDQQVTQINDLYHPGVAHAIKNSIRVSPQGNVIFLTGANMAGKSTLMKSISVAIYLAHVGFPVSASKMEFSVMDGMYTTINLPDDLGMGTSHFYAEVLRIKNIAEMLSSKNLVVVFDEMFRGTNVKDAAEATIALTEAFSTYSKSIFIISTHIVEAGETLKPTCNRINFVYLPTVMEGMIPKYTYKLKPGITEDRHGMVIINNEGILEQLDRGLQAQGQPAPESEKTLKEAKENPIKFSADRQTLKDLNILAKYKSGSIYSLFNHLHTSGGEQLLEQMFNQPLSNTDEINGRSSLLHAFGQLDIDFPFPGGCFSVVSNYLNSGTSIHFITATLGLMMKRLQGFFLNDTHYEQLHRDLLATIKALNTYREFIDCLGEKFGHFSSYANELRVLQEIFADPNFQWVKKEHNSKLLTVIKMVRYDFLLRVKLRRQMEVIQDSIYRLDLYISVSKVARERGFEYAEALPAESNLMRTTALWHPLMRKAIANDISMDKQNNMIFLTGANMAGKSTLLKSFGIAIYLAHMGFPVAARNMQFSVKDGLYSSINVTDDLSLGQSHFYAEVLRVKKVAEQTGSGKNMVILFDELFKGTNVKDAYDGTFAVSSAFAGYRNCLFMISTHIIEVGRDLQQNATNIQFAYLPTVMDGKVPRYTYQLTPGITADQQGMMIIRNEGILKTLSLGKTVKQKN